jgi:hypothetical protein
MPPCDPLDGADEWERPPLATCRGLSTVRLPYRDMTATDFRRIALSFDGAEQGSHMGAVDDRWK